MRTTAPLLGLLVVVAISLPGCKRAAAGGDYFIDDTDGWLSDAGSFGDACLCTYNLTVSDPSAESNFDFVVSCGPSGDDLPVENVGFTVPGSIARKYQRRQAASYWLGTQPRSGTLYQGNYGLEYEFGDLSDNGDDDESLRTEYIALIVHKLRVPESVAFPVSQAAADPIDIPEAGMDGLQIWCVLPDEDFRP